MAPTIDIVGCGGRSRLKDIPAKDIFGGSFAFLVHDVPDLIEKWKLLCAVIFIDG